MRKLFAASYIGLTLGFTGGGLIITQAWLLLGAMVGVLMAIGLIAAISEFD